MNMSAAASVVSARRCARLAIWASIIFTPALAAADATWLVLPLQTASPEDVDAAATVRDLLANEITTESQARIVAGESPCADSPCAQAAGKAAGADTAVFGRLARLGSKIIVTTTAVEVSTGVGRGGTRMTVDRIEDLEEVAARTARALVMGKTTDETAELGQVTQAEVQPAKRRKGESGIALGVGQVTPIDGAYVAGAGLLVDVGYWYEANDFAIEPRLGFRFNPSSSGEEGYRTFQVGALAHYILTRTDFAPFIGVGAGLRYVEETREEVLTAGQNVRLTSEALETEDGFGAGLVARVGFLLFRTYTMRVAVTADYDITFVDLHQAGYPQSLQFGLSVIF